jgi:restriction endonuclease S subunit
LLFNKTLIKSISLLKSSQVIDFQSLNTIYWTKQNSATTKGILGSTLLTLKPKRENFVELKHLIYLTLKFYEDDLMSHRTGSTIPHLDKDFLKGDYPIYSTYALKFQTSRRRDKV